MTSGAGAQGKHVRVQSGSNDGVVERWSDVELLELVFNFRTVAQRRSGVRRRKVVGGLGVNVRSRRACTAASHEVGDGGRR